MDRVLAFCFYKDFSPDGDEHYIVSYPFIENEYYYNILFSFRDKCECLEPLHIRIEMKRSMLDIATLYCLALYSLPAPERILDFLKACRRFSRKGSAALRGSHLTRVP